MPADDRALRDKLVDCLSGVPGSPFRQDIIANLRRAQVVFVPAKVSRDVTHCLSRNPEALAAQLHHVVASLPEPDADGRIVSWMEWEREEYEPPHGRSGCLLMRHLGDPDALHFFAAWEKPDGAIYHSYAIARWDLAAVAALADAESSLSGRLRALVGRGRVERTERQLFEACTAVVPDDLASEMAIWQDLEGAPDAHWSRAVTQTSAHAMGHAATALGCLIREAAAPRTVAGLSGPWSRFGRLFWSA